MLLTSSTNVSDNVTKSPTRKRKLAQQKHEILQNTNEKDNNNH